MAINTGEFEKIVITDAGRAMISGTSNNNTITFTRIALGDGQIQSPDDIFTLTKIKHECLSMPIVSKKDITNGQIRLEFRLNNSEIETGFTFREIGIMAHMADGIEQLYAYTYAKDPTQIYDKNTPIQERIIYADIVVGNSENINIILDLSNTYARMQDIADHNTDPTAHKTGIAGNAATSTKALQDTKGQQIDTTYIKSITASNATITATKGNGATSNITINNVAHATSADNATKATQDSDGKTINATYIKKASGTGENLTLASDNFGGQLTIKRNSGNAATIKYTNTNNVNRYIGFTGSDKTMYRWGDNGDGQTAFLDASNYNNYAPTKTGGGASGTWNISISGNAKTSSSTPILSSKGDISASSSPNTFSTGLTTHSAYNGSYPAQYGNVINVNNKGKSQLLLEWKGDDTAAGDPGHLYYRECRDNQNAWSNWKTIAFTSDNVASATKATQDSAGQTINTTYVKAVTASNATITVTKGNGTTSTATINNVSHATNADNATKATNDSSNRNIVNTYATKASPAFSGTPTAPTAAVSTNNTQIATTAFTQSLLKNKFTANTNYTGWSKNSVTGIVKQWGVVTYNSSPNPQVITPPISFSKLLTCGATDVGWKIGTGNTFANMEFTDGKLYIRPVYGNSQPGDNGVVLHWWVDCLL